MNLSAAEIYADLDQALAELLARDRIDVERVRKGKTKIVDLRPGLLSATRRGELELELCLRLLGEGNARASEIVEQLLGRPLPGARFVREKLFVIGPEGQLLHLLQPPASADAA